MLLNFYEIICKQVINDSKKAAQWGLWMLGSVCELVYKPEAWVE